MLNFLKSSICHSWTSWGFSSCELILRKLKRAFPLSSIISSRPPKDSQLTSHRISRQQGTARSQRSFLLLELLIALFLAGSFALPLAQLPMQATHEQIKSLYRIQAHHLADEGLAKLKEMLYKNEIAWNEIAKTSEGPIMAFEDLCSPSFPSLNRQFKRKVFLKCIHKKVKGSEEWWLMLARIEISSEKGKKTSVFKNGKGVKVFAQYLTLHKSSSPAMAP